MTLNVDAEVAKLVAEIKRLHAAAAAGLPAKHDQKVHVKFGTLFRETGDIFEALVGTLRAAKKRGIVAFDGELLLQGVHDDVDVTLLPGHGAPV